MNKANIFVIGVAKAGTTWLHYLLDSHPDIFMAKQVELFYFGYKYPDKQDWYHSNFPFDKNYRYFGESTAVYFENSEIAKEIKEYSPNSKIIAIVRDPIDRLLSQIYFAKQLGIFPENMPMKKILEENKKIIYYSHYEKTLPKYSNIFPERNFKVVSLEKAINETEELWISILNFLDLPVHPLPPLETSNKNATGSKIFRFIYKNTIRNIKINFPRVYEKLLGNKFMQISKNILLNLLGKAQKKKFNNKIYKKLLNEFSPTYDYLKEIGLDHINKPRS